MGSIEACKGRAKDLHVVAAVTHRLVHVLEVSVQVVSVPVQWVALHTQVISRKIARWIPVGEWKAPGDTVGTCW